MKRERRGAEVRLTHLGAAGWEITDGQRVILTDPYLSRLRYRSRFGLLDTPELPGDTRRAFGPDDELVSDTAAVDARITRADFILISHSHFNHCLDMPHIARKTGATVIGTESTIILARASGVPEAQLLALRGGEDYEFGALSIRVIPSLHSALNGKHYHDGRVGSMNYIEREVEGLRPDVALIAAARQRLEIHDYTGRLMRALGRPRLVFATHWDEQSLPYGAPQDQRLREAALFVKEVKAVSPRTRVVLPRHFETHVLPARRR